jgi:hypothetical protein
MKRFRRELGSKKGFGIVQVIIAMAAAAGLALLVTTIMSQMNKTQRDARLRGVVSNVESKYRSSLQSTRALANTRTNASNAVLSACFSATCTLDVAAPMALVDASGQVLIPFAQPAFVDDGGSACTPSTTDASCQWSVTAGYTPKGSAGVASSFDVVVTLAWAAPPGQDATFVMKPRQIAVSLAREMFVAPSSAVDCGVGESMYGINIDGTPKCRSALSNLVCPANRALVGFDASGAMICRTPVPYIAGCFWNNNASDHCVCPGGYVMAGHDLYSPGPGGMAYGTQCVCCALGVSL